MNRPNKYSEAELIKACNAPGACAESFWLRGENIARVIHPARRRQTSWGPREHVTALVVTNEGGTHIACRYRR